MAGDMESTDRQPLSGDGKGVKALGRLLAIAAAVARSAGHGVHGGGAGQRGVRSTLSSRFPSVAQTQVR